MPLHSGTKLGPYEILGPLGAGGMGEVYRARDTRLGRDVALKILPDHLSSNHERLRRFEQEARAASALNHPNIISIYDFGQSGSTFYIAMEFVDGRTLREILSTGSIPGRKLLDIAVQIADGLARAHAAGIIHRDLKPANVMINKDGFTKILDFGLAKLAEPQLQELSELPTVEKKQELTQSGAILGTVTYMSPEQASGRSIDYRSDQFSFGSILYEMATGVQAFRRDTAAETMSAIIKEEPQPIQTSNPEVPAPVRWIVERCLAKDPEDRYISTRDLARDLASIRDHISEASSRDSLAIAEAPTRLRPALWERVLFIGSILALMVVIGFLLKAPGSRESMKVTRLYMLPPEKMEIVDSFLSPDGRTLVNAHQH